MSRCRELWNEGDLHSLENEDLLLFKYLYACTDKELRKEMLKIEEPTAIKMEQFVRRYEVSRRENREISKGASSTAQAAQVKYKSGGGNRKKSSQSSQSSQTQPSFRELKDKLAKIIKAGGCNRCGSLSLIHI